jgi:hypothetical protein
LPLELHEQSATLTGVINVDDIEPLVAWLRTATKPRINLRNCNHLHTGVVQALLLFRPRVSAPPTDTFLAAWVLPQLVGSGGPPEPPRMDS